MPKNISPTKATGGGGFEFADKVAAYFMADLLSGKSPLDPKFGLIQSIAFETSAEGWLLDDLLLVLKTSRMETRCSFSIKSNRQFTNSSAPKDFVRTAWEQFLGEGSSPFKKEHDRFGLITSEIGVKNKANVDDLLKKARLQPSAEFASRISKEPSKEKRKILKSFSCPIELANKYRIDESHIGEFLKCFEHVEFDFESPTSKRLSAVIRILTDCLCSNSSEEAQSLWDSLCAVSGEMRASGGTVNLPFLIEKLRAKYELKDFPDHAPIWIQLTNQTRDEMSLIRDVIGKVKINRPELIEDINQELTGNKILVLIGESGCGKSVIQKLFAESHLESTKVVWVNSENILNFAQLPFKDLLSSLSRKSAFLIIDAVDRFYEDKLRSLAALMLPLLEQIEVTPLKIVISCQPEEFSRVQTTFSNLNVTPIWKLFHVTGPSKSELNPVWKEYPSLSSLAHHSHLAQFLMRPKILDLLARRILRGKAIEPKIWVGESGLSNWYWEEEVQIKSNGIAKSAFLKRLAERMADILTVELPETQFSTDDARLISELVKDRLLTHRNGRISFEHDLVADWARLKFLKEMNSDVPSYLTDKLVSPMWSKALRLFALHLLETDDIEEWTRLLQSFGEEEKDVSHGQDLILEASIFSSNPIDNLEKLWPELQKGNGILLQRLLNRFLYSATFPTKMALFIAQKYRTEHTANLLTTNREPYWFYWIPMITFLNNHKEDCIRFAPRQIAEICDKWLRFSKLDSPARPEAAEMAIILGEDQLAVKMSKLMYRDQSGLTHTAFRAELAACNEEIKRVLEFALIASGRKKPSGIIQEKIDEYNKSVPDSAVMELNRVPHILEQRIPVLGRRTVPALPPWSEGPLFQGDQDFYEICIEPEIEIDALHPLIRSFPDEAREIILGLLIELPRSRDIYDYHYKTYTGLIHPNRWFPPFYTRGPFLFFLNSHPMKAVELIIAIINFATDRWSDQLKEEKLQPSAFEIQFDWGKKSFIGDFYVYYWHRAVGSISHVIPSALMALEKWLYDRLERNEEITDYIETILKTGTSLSLIGLLVSVGKKKPSLFSQNLLPLLSWPEFYSWDSLHVANSERHQMIGWTNEGELMIKLAQDFNFMPHRRIELNEIAFRLFPINPNVQKTLEKQRKTWEARLLNSDLAGVSRDCLENLILWFDKANWKAKENSGTKEKSFVFEIPESVAEKRDQQLRELEKQKILIFAPIEFRRLLNNESTLSLDDANNIFEIVKHTLSAPEQKDTKKDEVLTKENVVCGGIAVLYKYFEPWVKQDPDRHEWCIQTITRLIETPPEHEDHPLSLADFMWDRFCAEVMPRIWADEPANPLFRKCMALLATNWHYETVQILFSVASEVRASLKTNFNQLLNLAINTSHARHQYYRENHLKKRSFNVNKWISNEVKKFQEGKYPTTTISLKAFAKDEIKRTNTLSEQNKKPEISLKRSGERFLDVWMLKAAFAWLPNVDQAINESERQTWLRFLKEAVIFSIETLESDERGEISGTPDDWDRWLLERIAVQITQLKDDENPQELWMPILELGFEGRYWVEDFLHQWFLKSIAIASSSVFVKRWTQMIEFVLKHDESTGFSNAYRGQLWWELLGMGYLIQHVWDESKKPIIREMKKYYKNWADANLKSAESLRLFCRVLTRPAFDIFLFDSLLWIDRAVIKADSDIFKNTHYDAKKSLSALLEVMWKQKKVLIKSDVDAYSAFKRLLTRLVNLQVPEAIELQQNLA